MNDEMENRLNATNADVAAKPLSHLKEQENKQIFRDNDNESERLDVELKWFLKIADETDVPPQNDPLQICC